MNGEKSILSINLGNFGSTGTIMRDISNMARKYGYITYMAYPKSKRNINSQKNDIIISSEFIWKVNQKLAYYTGWNGCFATFATLRLIWKIHRLKVDIIHLHNIHNSYLNFPLLFDYLFYGNYKVIWTLHDCWPFTGQCPHFIYEQCNRWLYGCGKCPKYKEYPSSIYDNSKKMYTLKKAKFTRLSKLVIVTPSQWLEEIVKKSFLCSNKIVTINNGIDLTIFKPSKENRELDCTSDRKKIILGVASDWSDKKGLKDFIRLAKDLPKYQIVLVGITDNLKKILPSCIKIVERTNDKEELARIYSYADVFVNPTLEDNFPTVNIEALACGTPVVTYNTGGSAEIIDESCGCVVEVGNYNELKKTIIYVISNAPYTTDNCVKRAQKYNKNNKIKEYIQLYDKMEHSC